MTANRKSEAPAQREICHREIPQPEAMNAEARGDVAHFCGIDGYRVGARQDPLACERAADEVKRAGQS